MKVTSGDTRPNPVVKGVSQAEIGTEGANTSAFWKGFFFKSENMELKAATDIFQFIYLGGDFALSMVERTAIFGRKCPSFLTP